MRYQSTRGGAKGISFKDSLLMGLATDGGLLVPESIPDITGELSRWRDLSFTELAYEVIRLFSDDISDADLRRLIDEAYSSFTHADVVALKELEDFTLIELFHGPTLAFKDVALQLLGKLFEHVLAERGERLNILGATSGDTGSAAIAAVRGQPNIDIFILYPDGKVSPLQELQMTTVPESNVHCIAVDGSFDDCQSLMKQIFADLDFKAELHLGAVNSVNWARVLAQVVYYGYASLKFDQPVTFCVPTGNFGNVFAGYFARRMGFPIDELLVATNENDILARFFATGDYARGEVHYTLSPAMDIQVASNFERFLYYYYDEDVEQLRAFMQQFAESGSASIGGPPDAGFRATAVSTAETLATLKSVYENTGYVLDPHTAVGVCAKDKLKDSDSSPLLCIATAHPAKFPEAVEEAVAGLRATHPFLDVLSGMSSRKENLAADEQAVKTYMRETLSA